ncbi:hypothetical protein Asppvi_010891 [Aspergillus pseudoviridinutans]|uniref:Zn(2)-C6 fungal-type domain-containing protein n=1 Tax=Aspergillus pseudoviridinutans TaxID=1517512 RepID=A0A9P3EXG5_9EURO|nr:uncharacterized protein Asppvi_010891 [Aspergillus pseudoviridinutans]GIJ91916.1 hypothetical protein Asppvi_010891 [Aspergillus pseudoviridinutans]
MAGGSSTTRREVRACERCRTLKVGCDKAKPACRRCVKAGVRCVVRHIESNGIDRASTNGDTSIRAEALDDSLRNRDEVRLTRCLLLPSTHAARIFCGQLERYRSLCCMERPVPDWHSLDKLSQGDLPWGLKKVESRSALLERMPTRVVGEKLISMYIDVVEKTHHFLDLPGFQQQLLHFWDHPTEAEDSWLALLFVIFFLGQEAHRTVACGSTDLLLGVSRTEFLEASQGFLHRTSFVAHPNLDIIRTLCLMVIAKQMVQMSCSAMDTSWCLTGLILRIAMNMGLHSARVDDPRLEKGEQQTLSILWTSIMYLNLRQAVLTGMPILLQPRDYTCAPSPNINGCSNQALALSNREETETFHVLFERAVPIASGLMDLSHDPARAETYEAIMHYTVETRRLLLHASEALRISHPTTSEARKAIMLDILFRRLLLSVHRPFAHDERAPLRYPLSYWTSLDCALAILVHQRDLWGAPPDDSLVSRSFARLFWPDFLVAALTLSLYLLRADSPLDPPPSSRYGGMPARATLQDALRSCRDIWQLEEDRNICHSHAFILIDRVVSALEETGRDGVPALHCADVQSAIDAVVAGVQWDDMLVKVDV